MGCFHKAANDSRIISVSSHHAIMKAWQSFLLRILCHKYSNDNNPGHVILPDSISYYGMDKAACKTDSIPGGY